MTDENVTAPVPAAAVAPETAAKVVPKMDINPMGRDRWGFASAKFARPMFIFGTLGAAIGLGNMWKFPNLTFKHGGVAFIIAYLIVLLLAGMPMLILEFTLGQKMQKGSAGALRGIIPRLAGVGWVASFSGFVVCLIYNMLLALTVYYMVVAGKMPWTPENWRGGEDNRPTACKAADKLESTSAELFLYMDVVKVTQEATCDNYVDGGEGASTPAFNASLAIPMIVLWIICGLMLSRGVKSFQLVTSVLVPLSFVLLIVLVI